MLLIPEKSSKFTLCLPLNKSKSSLPAGITMHKKIALSLFSFLYMMNICSQENAGERSSRTNIPVAVGIQIPLRDFSSTHRPGISPDYFPSPVIGPYKYPGFFLIQALGGLHYQVQTLSVSLLTGPGLGMYNGSTRFNIAGRFEINIPLKTWYHISPLVNLIGEPGTDLLWYAGMRLKLW